MRGHFNKNPPDLTIRGILGTIRLLAEVAVQQASESLAVTGLVASHLVNGALAALAGRFASYGTLLLWLLCFYRKVPIF